MDDRPKSQTSTATPAEPGELSISLGFGGIIPRCIRREAAILRDQKKRSIALAKSLKCGKRILIPLPHQSELGQYRNDGRRFVAVPTSIQAAMEAVSHLVVVLPGERIGFDDCGRGLCGGGVRLPSHRSCRRGRCLTGCIFGIC